MRYSALQTTNEIKRSSFSLHQDIEHVLYPFIYELQRNIQPLSQNLHSRNPFYFELEVVVCKNTVLSREIMKLDIVCNSTLFINAIV